MLLTNDEREKASRALEECKSRFLRYYRFSEPFNCLVIKKKSTFLREIIGSDPIEVEIRGVECMNDDPERVDVLYGRCIDNSGRLQKLADAIVDSLESDGLLDRQYDHVKLHATLMNSLFKVKDDSEENTMRSTFNAKLILQVFSVYLYFTVRKETYQLSG